MTETLSESNRELTYCFRELELIVRLHKRLRLHTDYNNNNHHLSSPLNI